MRKRVTCLLGGQLLCLNFKGAATISNFHRPTKAKFKNYLNRLYYRRFTDYFLTHYSSILRIATFRYVTALNVTAHKHLVKFLFYSGYWMLIKKTFRSRKSSAGF